MSDQLGWRCCATCNMLERRGDAYRCRWPHAMWKLGDAPLGKCRCHAGWTPKRHRKLFRDLYEDTKRKREQKATEIEELMRRNFTAIDEEEFIAAAKEALRHPLAWDEDEEE